jgi:hypothetical protein
MTKTLLPALALLLLAFTGQIMQQPEPVADEASTPVVLVDDFEFIGAARCKMCHNKEEGGAQYSKWAEGPHAGAFATLGTDEAKAIAAEKGIEDPQTAAECLQCHVTAHGVDEALLGSKYSVEEGVSCESCHGAGGGYYKKKDMQAITDGEADGAALGLVTPTEETCVTCHNENSPTFEGFDFAAQSAEIAHPIP